MPQTGSSKARRQFWCFPTQLILKKIDADDVACRWPFTMLDRFLALHHVNVKPESAREITLSTYSEVPQPEFGACGHLNPRNDSGVEVAFVMTT
jgi:hypothetical protein